WCHFLIGYVCCNRRPRYDKARGKTRVNLGAAFQRWRDLRERKGLKTDEEVALFLLDRWVTLVWL
uniref:Uncharacterized protein n=1 Tax=Lates calcarifer TaxID=8187 RepID=A0A4W6FWU0_LATCA